MFQGVSGDNDPIHYDVEFCKQKGHKNMLAHGFQVMSQTAAGVGIFPLEVRESLLGMIEISGKYLKPVYKNDTLYPELKIINLISQKTTGIIEMKATILNRNKDLVFKGIQKYLIKKYLNISNNFLMHKFIFRCYFNTNIQNEVDNCYEGKNYCSFWR